MYGVRGTGRFRGKAGALYSRPQKAGSELVDSSLPVSVLVLSLKGPLFQHDRASFEAPRIDNMQPSAGAGGASSYFHGAACAQQLADSRRKNRCGTAVGIDPGLQRF